MSFSQYLDYRILEGLIQLGLALLFLAFVYLRWFFADVWNERKSRRWKEWAKDNPPKGKQ